MPTDGSPPVLPGEAAFAASGTCLVLQGASNAWIGTGGGARARVFRSIDRGRSWQVADTPLHAGIRLREFFRSRSPTSGTVSLSAANTSKPKEPFERRDHQRWRRDLATCPRPPPARVHVVRRVRARLAVDTSLRSASAEPPGRMMPARAGPWSIRWAITRVTFAPNGDGLGCRARGDASPSGPQQTRPSKHRSPSVPPRRSFSPSRVATLTRTKWPLRHP